MYVRSPLEAHYGIEIVEKFHQVAGALLTVCLQKSFQHSLTPVWPGTCFHVVRCGIISRLVHTHDCVLQYSQVHFVVVQMTQCALHLCVHLRLIVRSDEHSNIHSLVHGLGGCSTCSFLVFTLLTVCFQKASNIHSLVYGWAVVLGGVFVSCLVLSYTSHDNTLRL